MSYYCKGEICQRSKDCLRVEAWRGFQKKDTKEGFNTGVWFVREQTCIKNGFEDGVFHDGEPNDEVCSSLPVQAKEAVEKIKQKKEE